MPRKPVTGKKRPRQKFIPGMEPPSIPTIDAAVIRYVQLRDERMMLTQDEVKAKSAVMQLMKDHDLPSYRTPDDYVVTLESEMEMTLSVKHVKPKKEESNGEE